jgi:hypothetical protein
MGIMNRTSIALAGLLVVTVHLGAEAQTLRGSATKMQAQNTVARQHDYTFLQTASDIRRFVDMGLLVPMRGNGDYGLAGVSFPYARPAVQTFVERLAAQYRGACGERLIVTSLTRPTTGQPANASALSVHPAGMAVDLRVPQKASCRRWLESTLVALDRQGVVSAIRENNPPHYHVAVFPTPYLHYVSRIVGGSPTRTASAPPAARPAQAASVAVVPAGPSASGGSAAAEAAAEAAALAYRVNRGDSLWSIARRHGTTIETLKELNGLNSTRIVAGQVLTVPSP